MNVPDTGQTHSYEPTTKIERDKRSEFLNSPTLQHNLLPHVEWELRLIADVERLDRQLGDELAADSVLCPHAPQHVLEAKCKELEAERGCPSCAHCQLKRGGHLD